MTELDDEAERLLWQLVEAARSVPRSQRGDFLALQFFGGNTIRHPGLPGAALENYDEVDFRDLIEAGVIRITSRADNAEMFDLRPAAFAYYDNEHRKAADPIAGQGRIVLEHMTSDALVARYSEAIAKWRDADQLLWQDESIKNLSTIGHLCREAMQLFAGRLIEIHRIADVEPDPAKTINRLHSVIAARRPHISSSHSSLLDALVDYWRAVNGVVQRQEHGETKGGADLTWDDARRVLLYTAMVMTECDRIL